MQKSCTEDHCWQRPQTLSDTASLPSVECQQCKLCSQKPSPLSLSVPTQQTHCVTACHSCQSCSAAPLSATATCSQDHIIISQSQVFFHSVPLLHDNFSRRAVNSPRLQNQSQPQPGPRAIAQHKNAFVSPVRSSQYSTCTPAR